MKSLKIIITCFASVALLLAIGFSTDSGTSLEIFFRICFVLLLFGVLFYALWRNELSDFVYSSDKKKRITTAFKIIVSVLLSMAYLFGPNISMPINTCIIIVYICALTLVWRKSLMSFLRERGKRKLSIDSLVVVALFAIFGIAPKYCTPKPTFYTPPLISPDEELWIANYNEGLNIPLYCASGDSIIFRYTEKMKPLQYTDLYGYQFVLRLSQPDTLFCGYFALTYENGHVSDSCYLRLSPKWIDDKNRDFVKIPFTETDFVAGDTIQHCFISRFGNNSMIDTFIVNRDCGPVYIKMRDGAKFFRKFNPK